MASSNNNITTSTTPNPRPTGTYFHWCPTCKKYGADVHISQGKPHPQWECADHTGDPQCIICNGPADYGAAEGWFCKEHKIRKPMTPERALDAENGRQHYNRLLAKSKALLGVSKQTGIKKTLLQIKVLDRWETSKFERRVKSSEWLYEVDGKRSEVLERLMHKLHRNAMLPGGDKPMNPSKNVLSVIRSCCDRAQNTDSGLQRDTVIIDSIFVVDV